MNLIIQFNPVISQLIQWRAHSVVVKRTTPSKIRVLNDHLPSADTAEDALKLQAFE